MAAQVMLLARIVEVVVAAIWEQWRQVLEVNSGCSIGSDISKEAIKVVVEAQEVLMIDSGSRGADGSALWPINPSHQVKLPRTSKTT